MKAYEMKKFGFDGLTVVDHPVPQPAADQVLVKMHAWSLNYRDLMTVTGSYNPRLKIPQVPLSDGAGEVVAVGQEVKRFKPGDRVANTFLNDGLQEPRPTSMPGRRLEREGMEFWLSTSRCIRTDSSQFRNTWTMSKRDSPMCGVDGMECGRHTGESKARRFSSYSPGQVESPFLRCNSPCCVEPESS